MKEEEILKNNLIILKQDKKYFYIEDIDGYKYRIYKNKKISVLLKYIKSNPYSLDNIRNFIKINGIKLILCSKKFESVHKPLTFIDENGHSFNRSWHNVIERKSYLCSKCSIKINSEKRKINQDVVKNEFKNAGYIILEDYTNNNVPIKCMTEDGYYGKISRANLINGKKIDIFSKLNPYTIENIRTYIKNQKIDVKILSNEFNGFKDNLLWECKCGNKFYKSWEEFKYRKKYVCNSCFNRMSSNEIKVENFLKENNIYFLNQYSFDECKFKKNLLFDFYIPNYNLCIEVQGEQHYKNVRFGGMSYTESVERFVLQRKKDKIKCDFCKKNKIKLLKISYIDILNENYKKILSYKLNINK